MLLSCPLGKQTSSFDSFLGMVSTKGPSQLSSFSYSWLFKLLEGSLQAQVAAHLHFGVSLTLGRVIVCLVQLVLSPELFPFFCL